MNSLTRTQEEFGDEYSYLNDNLEDKQCYFSLDSFSTKRNLNLG